MYIVKMPIITEKSAIDRAFVAIVMREKAFWDHWDLNLLDTTRH